MANLKNIRRRISSVQSTKKITKAMNMVAAAKLRKTEARLLSLRPYADTLISMVEHIGYHTDTEHPYFRQREGSRKLFVFVSGDKGLCGSFNSNVARKARDLVAENRGSYVVGVGKKIKESFKRMGIKADKTWEDIFSPLEYSAAKDISDYISAMYLEHKDITNVIFVFNRFKNSIVSYLDQEVFLPRIREFEEPRKIIVAEPSHTAMVEAAMSEYLEGEVFRILLESSASEFGARMSAMEAATDNAEDMINELVMKANRERQAIITTELTEIVNGANSI